MFYCSSIYVYVFITVTLPSPPCFLCRQERGGVCKLVRANCRSLMRRLVTDADQKLEGQLGAAHLIKRNEPLLLSGYFEVTGNRWMDQ